AQQTARIANVMGMTVMGVNTTGNTIEGFSKIYPINELKEALQEANIVINTLPETKDTIHLLEREHFECMDHNCLFINVG
ncbi:NAD(P)-dependent oxidoreductase, partial [Staphylococcus warneri]